MLVVIGCVLVGLMAGWITGHVMILSEGSVYADLLTGIVGATAAGVGVRMLGAGSTNVVLTLVLAAVSAVAVTFTRNVLASRA